MTSQKRERTEAEAKRLSDEFLRPAGEKGWRFPVSRLRRAREPDANSTSVLAASAGLGEALPSPLTVAREALAEARAAWHAEEFDDALTC